MHASGPFARKVGTNAKQRGGGAWVACLGWGVVPVGEEDVSLVTGDEFTTMPDVVTKCEAIVCFESQDCTIHVNQST